VDRPHELEQLRHSLAMLPPRAKVLDREDAMALVVEVAEVLERLERLRAALRVLVDDVDRRADELTQRSTSPR
jgi:hypothetical protein